MSNFLAIATVTAALQRVLQSSAQVDVPGAVVTTSRPDGQPAGSPGPAVNIYLYQVAPNAALRNGDLPTRNANADVVRRPRVALDLHYLLSFYGSEERLEPQRLLGSVVRTLHARPLLSAPIIDAVKAAATAMPPTNPFLADTDLSEQVELVRLTPLSISLDELSKLWSVFFQIPHALSVAYIASVVLIEEDVEPVATLPVLERDLVVRSFGRPEIHEVVAATGPDNPIIRGSTVVIRGRALRGDVTRVRVAGEDRAALSSTAAEVRFDLSTVPTAQLRPGPQVVQVVQQTLMGDPPTPHVGEVSNAVTFPLHPVVTGVGTTGTAASGTVTVDLDLEARPEQRVVLLLLEPATAERLFLFPGPERTSSLSSLDVDIAGAAPGDYLVQVAVDGAESPLETDAGGNVVGPAVTLT